MNAVSVMDHWKRAEAFGPDFNGSPCMHLPNKPDSKGYVRIYVGLEEGRRRHQAHRAIYEALRAKIPEHLELDHLCRNPGCVNPWHMEPVTGTVNVLRGVGPTAVNARKTVCIKGHELVGENLYHSSTGGRACRACALIRAKEHKSKRNNSDGHS